MPENQPQSPARPNCARCRRPLHEFPHASFNVGDDAAPGFVDHGDGSAYHGEVRNVSAGFADVYVFGYGEFHVRASRLALSDAVDA
jgi:hypothetical protein